MSNVTKVLIVEDAKTTQELIKSFLDKLKCESKIANNGLEAIQEAKDVQFDLILMDLDMPVMDGLVASETIRREVSKDIPIIAITETQTDKRSCMMAGMNDFYLKPITFEMVKEIVEKYQKK